jgi:sec-independent protein translocase protein TatA
VDDVNLGPTELIIILVIVLLLFGSTKLPKLARSLGQAKKEFEAGTDDADDEVEVERRTVTERTVAERPAADEPKPPTAET